ncbi:hypothetical protein [Borrelia hermsii]|uniref:hypothetical protein n=1 Tax=Borrelia hermsii TaxID=140 RepID=UPI00046CF1FA|nr:hypothetical protein [Borrelia hermsii]
MKISKIFVVLLSVLAFSCNLSDLLGRDGLDGQGGGIEALIKGGLMAAKQGADYLVDALEDEYEYEYVYVDEDGNVVYVDYDSVAGYYPGAVNELEDKGGVDVSAGGVVVAKPGELAGSGDVKVASIPAENQEAVTVQATEVEQKEPSKEVDKKVDRKADKQQKRRNKNRTTTSQTRWKPRGPVSSILGTRVAYSYVSSSPRSVSCRSTYGGGGSVIVITDEEKKLFGYLEKYLEDAIKVNGRSTSEQKKN